MEEENREITQLKQENAILEIKVENLKMENNRLKIKESVTEERIEEIKKGYKDCMFTLVIISTLLMILAILAIIFH